jgi:hypothetical protein
MGLGAHRNLNLTRRLLAAAGARDDLILRRLQSGTAAPEKIFIHFESFDWVAYAGREVPDEENAARVRKH